MSECMDFKAMQQLTTEIFLAITGTLCIGFPHNTLYTQILKKLQLCYSLQQ